MGDKFQSKDGNVPMEQQSSGFKLGQEKLGDMVEQLNQVFRRRECVVLFGFFFILVLSLSISAVLLETEPSIPADVAIFDISQPFDNLYLPAGEKVYIGLNLEVTGLHMMIVDAESVNGQAAFDPTVTLWQRPDTFVNSVDDFGPTNVNPILTFNVGSEDLFENQLVAEVFSQQASGEGLFTLGVFPFQPDLHELNVPFTLPFTTSTANGGQLMLESGKTYVITAYSDEFDMEDRMNTAIYILDSNGVAISSSYGTSSEDFSARILFTPAVTSAYIIQLRIVDIVVLAPDSIPVRVLVAEVDPPDLQISPTEAVNVADQFMAAASNVYRFTPQSSKTYRFNLQAELFTEFVQYVSREFTGFNVTADVPRFLPSLKIVIFDNEANRNVIVREMSHDYQVDSGNETFTISIVNASEVDFDLTVTTSRPMLIDIFALNPEYYTEQPKLEIGSFTLTIEELPETDEAAPPPLVDENDPFATCLEDPTELLARGCLGGVFLYCRQIYQPMLSFANVTVEAVNELCSCTEFLCVEFPTGESQSDLFIAIRNVIKALLAVLCTACLFVVGFLLSDYLRFKKTEGIVWDVTHPFLWFLCVVFCVAYLFYLVTDFRIDITVDQLVELNDVFSRRALTSFESTDVVYYDTSPFDDIYQLIETTPTNPPTTIEPELFMTEAALSVFEAIDSNLDDGGNSIIFIMVNAILASLTLMIFLEISASWVQASASATTISRTKQERLRRRMFKWIRIFQVVIAFGSLSYAISLLRTGGAAYNNFTYVIYTVGFFLTSILLGYSRYKFTQMLTFERKPLISPSHIQTENKALQNALRPVQDVSIILLLCSLGIAVANILFTVFYTSRAERVAGRNEVAPETAEIFEQMLSIIGVLAVVYFLILSHFETKKGYIATYFVDESPKEVTDTLRPTTRQIVASIYSPGSVQQVNFRPSEASIPEIDSIYYKLYSESVIDSVPESSGPEKTIANQNVNRIL